MIDVSNLKKVFKNSKKKITAVDNITFGVKPGEIFGLLGPNGAGKTTTLRILATMLKPDSGTAKIGNFDVINDSKKVRSIIGFLTSDMRLSGSLSPRQLLKFFGELNHLSPETIQKRITSLVDYFEIGSFLDKPVEKLSTGMKQKTSIAVSLIHDPQVILFDEPTNGLDILAAKIVMDFLNDYKKLNKTILLSTHILSDAEKVCDKIGIIIKGKLVVQGIKEELLRRYNSSSLDDVFYSVATEKGGVNYVS